TGVRDGSLLLVDKVERERGESVAEFSIGNAHHDWNSAAERNYDFSTDRDLESAMSDLTAEDDIYDKKTSVKRMHDYEPGVDGSTERYRTEMTTTTLSKGFSKH
ncbi:unnamed protein product, partial [Thelazia callipaeda]|uniref:Polyprotein n=1 Tax=Thelazia callipaeda TaxID=103827 RepID=A0A0N5D5R2_THECL